MDWTRYASLQTPSMNVCEICGTDESKIRSRLIAPCDCYKKYEDCGKMHLDCFQEYIQLLSQESDIEGPPRCPRCDCVYEVKLYHRFVCDWAHVCKSKALANACEFAMISFVFIMMLFTFSFMQFMVSRNPFIVQSQHRHRHGRLHRQDRVDSSSSLPTGSG